MGKNRETCPVCGKALDGAEHLGPGKGQHRCKRTTLDRIDAAYRTDSRAPRPPSYGERLARGFGMIDGD
jgi:hypothetical protein